MGNHEHSERLAKGISYLYDCSLSVNIESACGPLQHKYARFFTHSSCDTNAQILSAAAYFNNSLTQEALKALWVGFNEVGDLGLNRSLGRGA